MFINYLILVSLLALLSTLALTTTTTSPTSEYLFTNPPTSLSHTYQIPTVHDSAILARRLLNLSSIASLSTVFPTSSSLLENSDNPHWPHLHAQQQQQQQQPLSHYTPPNLDVSGLPIGLMDYYAACPPHPWSPTLIAVNVATTFRNTRAGSNVSLSLRWHPPTSAPPSDDPYTYSPPNMPRFSLEGYVEPLSQEEVAESGVEECFFDRHGEAKAWRPGNRIHASWWARLVVKGVYWVGGFGDRSYIGWIPVEEWEGVTSEEVEGARLVGEEGHDTYEAMRCQVKGE